jgi:hypothetical protein
MLTPAWSRLAEPCSYCVAVRVSLSVHVGPCCRSHWQTLYNEARVGCWPCAGVHGAAHVGCLHNKHQPTVSTAGDACSYRAAVQAAVSARCGLVCTLPSPTASAAVQGSFLKASVELLACAGVFVVGVAGGGGAQFDVLCQLVCVGCSGGWILCPLYSTVHAVVASCQYIAAKFDSVQQASGNDKCMYAVAGSSLCLCFGVGWQRAFRAIPSPADPTSSF